jgi:hypothetical protein
MKMKALVIQYGYEKVLLGKDKKDATTMDTQ